MHKCAHYFNDKYSIIWLSGQFFTFLEINTSFYYLPEGRRKLLCLLELKWFLNALLRKRLNLFELIP